MVLSFFVFSVSLCLCGEKALFPRSSTPVTITKDCLVPGKSLSPPRQPICFSYGELNQQYSSQPRQRGREAAAPKPQPQTQQKSSPLISDTVTLKSTNAAKQNGDGK